MIRTMLLLAMLATACCASPTGRFYDEAGDLCANTMDVWACEASREPWERPTGV